MKCESCEMQNCKHCSLKAKHSEVMKRHRQKYEYELDAEPLREFHCRNCGKKISVYSSDDPRVKYCCSTCAKRHRYRKKSPAKKRRAKATIQILLKVYDNEK